MARFWVSAAAAYFLMLTAPSWAADFVVIASNVGGVTSGKVVSSNDKLDIPAGKEVTLISAAGKVLKLQGPFSGAPKADSSGGAAGGNLIASLAKLAGDGGTSSASLGGMRSVGGSNGKKPGPWEINAGRAGHYCIRNDELPNLWRSRARKAAKTKVQAMPNGASITVDWKVGKHRLKWPEDILITQGGTYMVKVGGKASKITIHLAPSKVPSMAHRVVWMAERGCTSQATALLATLR